MRFACLGSGSRGNATLIEHRQTCIMVDCGFSTREVERRLQRLQREPGDITAILVTHEHSDHLQGVARLARKYSIPVWMTSGTQAALQQEVPELRTLNAHESLVLGDLEINPFPVPHDAREPCQFVFNSGSSRFAILTDAGSVTTHMLDSIAGVDAMMLECNHDREMLSNGRYPAWLKQRVGGDYGHLNNDQSADILCAMDSTRLKTLVASHLSSDNNSAEQVRHTLSAVTACDPGWVQVAGQELGCPWQEVGG